jgi:hypothetical protein
MLPSQLSALMIANKQHKGYIKREIYRTRVQSFLLQARVLKTIVTRQKG